MKTSFKTIQIVSLILSSAAAVMGCSGSSSSADGGDSGAAGSGGAGGTAFGLSKGDTCFDVLSVQGTPTDGCAIGVAAVVGSALPVNYDDTTGILKVGTDGSLGGGAITFNMGTLTRVDSVAMEGTCSWHQMDTSMVTVTATNAFTIAVTENESMFAAACNPIPAGGTCTSTWTWTMKKSTTKTTATMCK
ncbi:MAG: hypothetical protein JWM82_3937 [Myxococcales bacterium]|nr:hypothetical protein [Myxococcales bacterium]